MSDLIVDDMIHAAQKKVASMQSCWGKAHPKLIKALQNLADLYLVLARFDEAKPIYRRIVEIQYTLYGPKYPGIAESLLSLGELYEAASDFDSAVQFYVAGIWILDHNDDCIASDTLGRLLLKLYGAYRVKGNMVKLAEIESRLYIYLKRDTTPTGALSSLHKKAKFAVA